MFAHFKQHPPVLRIFFGTEMWERYGFYVIQALLSLYLALHFHWSDAKVYTLVSAFTGLTYLSPAIGGFIADKWLGQKKAILTGTAFLLTSYVALALMQTDAYLKFALASVAVGTGLLKPNISSLLGHAYPKDAPERESGFTIFYMGLVSGIILGTTLPSILQQHVGWSAAFASAAIGVGLAIYIFSFGIIRYRIADYQEYQSRPTQHNFLYAIATIISLWFVCLGVLFNTAFGSTVFMGVLLASIYFIFSAARGESRQQAKQTYVIGLLCIISILYWAFYWQMFLSFTLFITRTVEPQLFGMTFPAPYYVCVQSIGMLVFGYFLSKKQHVFHQRTLVLRTAGKFFIAVLLMLAAFVIFRCSIFLVPGTTLISPLFILPAYLFISVSELILSPVGLSIVTVLAHRKHVSTLTGIFLLSLSLGGYLAGPLAQLTAMSESITDISIIKVHYATGFNEQLLVLCAAMVVSYGIYRFIRYLILK